MAHILKESIVTKLLCIAVGLYFSQIPLLGQSEVPQNSLRFSHGVDYRFRPMFMAFSKGTEFDHLLTLLSKQTSSRGLNYNAFFTYHRQKYRAGISLGGTLKYCGGRKYEYNLGDSILYSFSSSHIFNYDLHIKFYKELSIMGGHTTANLNAGYSVINLNNYYGLSVLHPGIIGDGYGHLYYTAMTVGAEIQFKPITAGINFWFPHFQRYKREGLFIYPGVYTLIRFI